MKIKFNKFERVAGLFVGSALLGLLAVAGGVAVKKGWFSSKISFETTMTSGDGIHAGTLVQIAGLRAGSVSDIELLSAEKVRVRFEVFEKFRPQIRRDSMVQVLRPFIIGDKVLEISVGNETEPELEPGQPIALKESFDIMDVVSGKKMGPFMGTLDRLSASLMALGEAFADPERTKSLVKMFDRMAPLMSNVNEMAIGMVKITDAVTKQKRLELLLSNLTQISTDLGQVIPAMVKESPDMGRQLGQMVNNLNILTAEMQKLAPAIATIAPELPKTSLKAVEALNETVVLLKALQKSFLLRGKVEEVRQEERQPASSSAK
ncbi:MAG: MlaD family protein [Bdellovibrionales bacterium]